jgi:hypothetical protein
MEEAKRISAKAHHLTGEDADDERRSSAPPSSQAATKTTGQEACPTPSPSQIGLRGGEEIELL